MTDSGYGDPVTAPLWAAARDNRLLLQRCVTCGRYQHFPRPYCLACQSDVEWTAASGRGTVYAQTTVRMSLSPYLKPPYLVALVDLEEGPRVLANVIGAWTVIGDPVRLDWLQRPDAPPLPVVRPV